MYAFLETDPDEPAFNKNIDFFFWLSTKTICRGTYLRGVSSGCPICSDEDMGNDMYFGLFLR